MRTSYKTLYVGNESVSSFNKSLSANNVYRLCGLMTSYFLLCALSNINIFFKNILKY